MIIICFRKNLILFTLFFHIWISCSPAFSQSGRWNKARNFQFNIYYHFEDRENISGLQDYLTTAFPDIEARLGVTLPYNPQIFLVTSQEEFDQITGGSLPNWSQGVSFPQKGVIVLKSPSFSHDIDTFHRTAVHELTHIMIAVKAGMGIPRWFNEGLAQILSGEGQGKEKMPISRALWSGKLIPLMSVENVDRFPRAQADLAYLQSYHAAEFLLKQHGWETIRQLLQELGAGKAWEEALFNNIEMDQAGLEAEWLSDLGKSYRWVILLDTQIYLFIGATILVLFAGVAMIRRRRKIYKRWEEEEGPQAEVF